VGVDRVQSRIELAKSFGATASLDTTGSSDLQAAFKDITGGDGPTVIIDSEFLKFVNTVPAYLNHPQRPALRL